MVVWIIGLSGAGKTTIAKILFDKIRQIQPNWVLLDGDTLRDVWGDKLGHSIKERALNAHRISNLCKLLDDHNINIIATVLSIFPEWQKWNRDQFSHYYEVFLDIDLSKAIERDVKGIYASALRGEEKNVVGIDIDFVKPTNSNLVLDSSGKTGSASDLAEQIFNKLKIEKL